MQCAEFLCFGDGPRPFMLKCAPRSAVLTPIEEHLANAFCQKFVAVNSSRRWERLMPHMLSRKPKD